MSSFPIFPPHGVAKLDIDGNIADVGVSSNLIAHQVRKGLAGRLKTIASCQQDEFLGATESGVAGAYCRGPSGSGWSYTGAANCVFAADTTDYEYGSQCVSLSTIDAEYKTVSAVFLPPQTKWGAYPNGSISPPTLKSGLYLRMKVGAFANIETLTISVQDPLQLTGSRLVTLLSRTETNGMGATFGVLDGVWHWVFIPYASFAASGATYVPAPWGWGDNNADSASNDGVSTTIVCRRAMFTTAHVGEKVKIGTSQYPITAVSGTVHAVTGLYPTITVTGLPTVVAGTVVSLLVPYPEFPLAKLTISLVTRTTANGYLAPPVVRIGRVATYENEKARICIQLDEPYQKATQYLRTKLAEACPSWKMDLNYSQVHIGSYTAGTDTWDDVPRAYGFSIASPAQGNTYTISATLGADTHAITITAGATPTVASVIAQLIAEAESHRNAGTAPWNALSTVVVTGGTAGDKWLVLEHNDAAVAWTATATLAGTPGTGTFTTAPWYPQYVLPEQMLALEAEGHGINHHGRAHFSTPFTRSSGAVTCSTSADGKTVTASGAFFTGINVPPGVAYDAGRTITVLAYSGTDLVADADHATNKKVTSASHNFVAADVGKRLNITAGTDWVVGWYTIASVDTNAAVLNAVAAADEATGGTWAEHCVSVIENVSSTTVCTVKYALIGSLSTKTFSINLSADAVEWDLQSDWLRSMGLAVGEIIPIVLPGNQVKVYDETSTSVDALPIVQRCAPLCCASVHNSRWGWADQVINTSPGIPHPYQIPRIALVNWGGASMDVVTAGYTARDYLRLKIAMKTFEIFYAHEILPTAGVGDGSVSEQFVSDWVDYVATFVESGDVEPFLLRDLYYWLYAGGSSEPGKSFFGLLPTATA